MPEIPMHDDMPAGEEWEEQQEDGGQIPEYLLLRKSVWKEDRPEELAALLAAKEQQIEQEQEPAFLLVLCPAFHAPFFHKLKQKGQKMFFNSLIS